MNRTYLPAALAIALTGTLALGLHAQQPQEPQLPPDPPMPAAHLRHAPNPHHQAMHLAKQLSLTPDQTAKLEPILADRDQKVAALQSNPALDRKDLHRQMHAIQQDTQQQLAGILTPDQLQQMKSLHHGHGPHGPGQNPPPQPAPTGL